MKAKGIANDFLGVIVTIAIVAFLLWAIPALCNVSMDFLAWALEG